MFKYCINDGAEMKFKIYILWKNRYHWWIFTVSSFDRSFFFLFIFGPKPVLFTRVHTCRYIFSSLSPPHETKIPHSRAGSRCGLGKPGVFRRLVQKVEDAKRQEPDARLFFVINTRRFGHLREFYFILVLFETVFTTVGIMAMSRKRGLNYTWSLCMYEGEFSFR